MNLVGHRVSKETHRRRNKKISQYKIIIVKSTHLLKHKRKDVKPRVLEKYQNSIKLSSKKWYFWNIIII